MPCPGPFLVDLGNPVSNHPLNEGLAAWWLPLPHNSGTGRLYDIVRRPGYDGTLTNGPTWTPGPSGFGGVSLDGSNDYVDCGTGAFVSTGPLTLSCWFCQTAASSYTLALAGLMSRYHTASENAYTMRLQGSSLSVAGASNLTGGTRVLGRWHHAVATIASATSAVGYLDGVQVLSGNPAISAGTSALRLGGDFINGGDARYFTGYLGDARFYSRALSAAEVWGLYEQGLRGHPYTLRRYTPRTWGFGEEGTTLASFSSAFSSAFPTVAAPGGGNRRRRVLVCGRV